MSMVDSGRWRWLRTAMPAGLLYGAVGIAFGALAGLAASTQARTGWRFAAYAVSALVFVAHMAHEHFRNRSAARQEASHVAMAVALGGLVLALAANIHDLGSASGYRPRMLIALAGWPILTGVPAFIVALALATGLHLKRPGAHRSRS